MAQLKPLGLAIDNVIHRVSPIYQIGLMTIAVMVIIQLKDQPGKVPLTGVIANQADFPNGTPWRRQALASQAQPIGNKTQIAVKSGHL